MSIEQYMEGLLRLLLRWCQLLLLEPWWPRIRNSFSGNSACHISPVLEITWVFFFFFPFFLYQICSRNSKTDSLMNTPISPRSEIGVFVYARTGGGDCWWVRREERKKFECSCSRVQTGENWTVDLYCSGHFLSHAHCQVVKPLWFNIFEAYVS